MNFEDTAKLCALVGRVCPQQQMVPPVVAPDGTIIEPGTAALWAPTLSGVRLADATTAVQRLRQRQRFIDPSEIVAEVAVIRAERLDALPQNQRPVPNVDPNETRRYATAVRAIETAIADGDIRTDGNGGFILPSARWQAAITAGPAGETREVDYSQVFSEHRASLRAAREAERAKRDAQETERRERERQLAALAEMQEAYARARAAKLGRKRQMRRVAAKSLSVPVEKRTMGEEPQAARDAAAS